MGLLGRIGGFLNDFYGGGEEDDQDDYGLGQGDDQDDSDKDDSDKDDADKDDSEKDDSEKDDNESGYGDDDDNPSGFGEDKDPNKEGDDPDNPDKEDNPENKDDKDKKDKDKDKDKEDDKKDDKKKDDAKNADKADKLQLALMKKEAITHGCSPHLEEVPCPICHKRSIYKSYRVFDWFPLLIGARVIGVNLYRYYCFNKRCSKSWYKGYVFNSPTPKFTPASAPTKRQFNAS